MIEAIGYEERYVVLGRKSTVFPSCLTSLTKILERRIMKYLEDDRLTQWTAALTDVPIYSSGSSNLGGSNAAQPGPSRLHRYQSHERVLFGRMEAYTMKRTGSDKRYAHALGAKYVEEMEQVENELARLQQQEEVIAVSRGRKRSQSAGTFEAMQTPAKSPKVPRRTRAVSIDLGAPAAPLIPQPEKVTSSSYLVPQATSLGDFMELGTRRLMTDLILTLNASFPDYDFSNVRASHFAKLTRAEVVDSVNQRMMQWAMQQSPSSSPSAVLNDMWKSMDHVIQLEDCQVYSYVPPPRDTEDDPLSFLTQTLVGDVVSGEDDDGDHYDGESPSVVPLWSFNYFFVNKSLKRILFFTCIEVVRCHTANSSDDDDDDDDQMDYSRMADATASGDFDLDPASDVAGGIPVTTV